MIAVLIIYLYYVQTDFRSTAAFFGVTPPPPNTHTRNQPITREILWLTHAHNAHNEIG